jgi:predicted transposase YbfD/YdcC
MDIVLLVLCGTIAGADDFIALHDFAKTKQLWFRERLGLKLTHGIPSHDTLNRVFALVSPTALHACFLKWVEFASEKLQIKQIAIDGKAMRGTRRGACPALAIVSAWATEAGMTLAQVRTEQKSNEITAIPELLELLDISGALVTIDAAGCQKNIAQVIVEKDGDYLLAVKENQPRLYEDIHRLATQARETDYAGLSQHRIEERGHGRWERRFCFVINKLDSIRDHHLWKDLTSVVCVLSSRTVNGKTSDETRYYISSRKARAKPFLEAVRSHWGIENPCHWVLDVAFQEDHHRLREGHAAENLALIRKMTLAMLKKAKAKCGIKNKRLKAGWDDAFLEHVLRDFLDD